MCIRDRDVLADCFDAGKGQLFHHKVNIHRVALHEMCIRDRANKERRMLFCLPQLAGWSGKVLLLTERRIIMNTLVIVLIAAVVLVCAYAF